MFKEYIERESLLVGIGSPESGLDDIINTLIFEHNLDFLHDYDEDEVRVFAKDLISNVRNYIQTEPTADVVEVKRGKWIATEHCEHLNVICSNCNKDFYVYKKGQYRIDRSNYCPECGARMECVGK